MIISDAFGRQPPNIKVLADAYAKRGSLGSLTVYLPDSMDGRLGTFFNSRASLPSLSRKSLAFP